LLTMVTIGITGHTNDGQNENSIHSGYSFLKY
jgi:hypothetical protein